ncbi:hypothetical protein CLOM_g3020, partial [Closterium sp. NIES-68]
LLTACCFPALLASRFPALPASCFPSLPASSFPFPASRAFPRFLLTLAFSFSRSLAFRFPPPTDPRFPFSSLPPASRFPSLPAFGSFVRSESKEGVEAKQQGRERGSPPEGEQGRGKGESKMLEPIVQSASTRILGLVVIYRLLYQCVGKSVGKSMGGIEVTLAIFALKIESFASCRAYCYEFCFG